MQRQYVDCVTAKGKNADGTRSLAENAIWDLRRRASHRCHDRPGLVEGLAEALSWYELLRGGIDLAISTLHEDAIRGLQSLRRSLMVVQMLRRKNKLRRKPALRALSSKRLRQAHNTLATAVEALSVEDYAEYAQVDGHLTRLQRSLDRERDARMRTAFQRDGPPDEAYGHEAVYYAIAVILNQLGLEEGTTWYDITERLPRPGDPV